MFGTRSVAGLAGVPQIDTGPQSPAPSVSRERGGYLSDHCFLPALKLSCLWGKTSWEEQSPLPNLVQMHVPYTWPKVLVSLRKGLFPRGSEVCRRFWISGVKGRRQDCVLLITLGWLSPGDLHIEGCGFWLVLHSNKPLKLTLELSAHLVCLASSPLSSVTLPSWWLLWLS